MITVLGFNGPDQVSKAEFVLASSAANFVNALRSAFNISQIAVMDYKNGQRTNYDRNGKNWKITMAKLDVVRT